MSWIRQLRPKLNRHGALSVNRPRTVYLSVDTSQRLDKAALAEGMSNSVYIEQTLRARFKKEGIERVSE